MEKIKQTKIKKYGSLFNNRDKAKITVLKKYGVENVSQIPEVKTKVTNKGRYYTKPDAIVETVRRNINRKKPNLVKECLVCNTKFECRDVVSIRDKKYCSVKCYKQNVVNRFNTKPEIKFRNMLLQYSVPFNTQFYLKGKWFDFKINNTLIEIDGVYWHGKGILYEDMPQWRKQIFDNDRYKDRLANENNYKLIRIWEDELDNLNIQQLLNEIK
jgi:very-short-patch-repair endonuclease